MQIFFFRINKYSTYFVYRKIDFSEPNMFERVHHEVKLLYSSGTTLYKTNNYMAAVGCFKKAVNMLHRCRLADEEEEAVQEKLLKKLYINLVVCYNKSNKPLMACTACNELNRLGSLWNNAKVLFHNARALKKIGQFDEAEKRLKRAMKLQPGDKEMELEYELLMKSSKASKEAKQNAETVTQAAIGLVSDEFKREVDDIIGNFKINDEEDQLIIPSYFNSDEIDYFKEVCVRENLFFNKIDRKVEPDEEQSQTHDEQTSSPLEYLLEKIKND